MPMRLAFIPTSGDSKHVNNKTVKRIAVLFAIYWPFREEFGADQFGLVMVSPNGQEITEDAVQHGG